MSPSPHTSYSITALPNHSLQVTDEDEQLDNDASSSSGSPTAQALDRLYFMQYDDPSTHLPYLQDSEMLSAYSSAIRKNAAFLKGKVVVDVGCGPALPLALMCAQVSSKTLNPEP